MAEPLIISVSGMRGVVGDNLTSSIAADYGSAFGTFLKNTYSGKKGKPSVCIGTDSRPSGRMLNAAVTTGLTAVGIDVIQLGIVTTPGVGVMVSHLGCGGGVVVTASHNPIRYNGIKLLMEPGIAPAAETAEQIKQYFLNKRFTFVDSTEHGRVTSDSRTARIHIGKVLSIVDRKKIAAKKFRVVLDSVNGAGAGVTKKLLGELGCEVHPMNDEPTGLFPHPPEPTAENLTALSEAVKNKRADIGFGQDPDADRLAVVDENAAYIGEEYTLALAAKYIFSKKCGKAATNLSTSRMIDDIATVAGGQVIRTPVGEANVASAMVENNCIIGGEGNGGIIDLRVVAVRDSLVAIVLVLQLMAETQKSISELVGEIGGYYMTKHKFTADKSQAQQILDSAVKLFTDAKLDTTDGCRFDFNDGWLHLRTSNTEPVMRLVVEANDRQIAEKYINAVMNLRKKATG